VRFRVAVKIRWRSSGFIIRRAFRCRRQIRAPVSASIIVSAIVPAVPVPVIVNPTRSGVNRRPPEGTPPVPTDYAPDNQADRPGYHQARAGTENRADVIRVRTVVGPRAIIKIGAAASKVLRMVHPP
jgi:hypothetical protein